mgnify:CR=1 FL=1
MIAIDTTPSLSELHEALRREGVLPVDARVEFILHPSSFQRDRGEHRWHYAVQVENRPLCHLIVGRQLRRLHEKADAFARICPSLACRPLFFQANENDLDILGLEHFSGMSLDAAVENGRYDAPLWLAAVRHAQMHLQSSERPSDFGRLEAELQTLVEAVCAQPALSDFDRTLIRTLVQPVILNGARRNPPVTRWSNGDFSGRNLLLAPQTGAVRLIDYEHAGETHFGDDDWSRLFHFSVLPAGLGIPPERATLGEPWREAYCWLRQLHLTRIIQPVPELSQHLAEIGSRLLAVVAAVPAVSHAAIAGSRLIALATQHQANTAAALAAKDTLLAAHATSIEHLSRLLDSERKLAADREKNFLREISSAIRMLMPSQSAPITSETESWNALRHAMEKAGEDQRRELAYLRDALALQRPGWTHLFETLRHRLSVMAEWGLGALRPRIRPHRFRGATWVLRAPVGSLWIRTSTSVEIAGWLRDFDDRPPEEVFAWLGRRRVVGCISATAAETPHAFTIRFRTKPGFKFVRIHARWHDGSITLLGCRMLFCETPKWAGARARSAPSPDNTAKTSIAAFTPEAIELPACAAPIASIVIPVFNQTDLTLRCLDAIARTAGGTALETIVVDDASTESGIAQLQRVRNLRLLRHETNCGFVRSCNNGAQLARGRYLVLLNNDTIVQPGWLEALIETFTLRPAAGLVGAKLLYPDHTLQEAGGICWRDGSAWNYGRNQDPRLPAFNFLRETDYCSAACIAVPTDLWRELHGLDEAFTPAYYEDTDLAFRVRAAGRKVYYQPQAVVIHDEGRSNGTDTSIGIKSYQTRNQHLFRQRWTAALAGHEPNGSRVFRARDRSLRRKIILVVDHHVPRPDRDAGSRNMMTYLRFLLSAGWSVKFVGDDGLSHPPYTGHLEQMGIEVLVGESFKNREECWLAEHGAELDCVFLSRPFTAQHWIGILRRHTAAPVVFYGHDLLSRSLRRAYESLRAPQFLIESCAYEAVEREVFSHVDWILYPSADEVDWLHRQLPAARVARIPLLVFGKLNRERPSFAERRGLLFVGGFGHPPNIDAILHFVANVWPALREQNPALQLTIAGSHPTEAIEALAGPDIRLRHDISDRELEALYDEHRVVIVPLRYGGGIKGKILEAMSLGVPVVTTPVGAEGLSWDRAHLLVADEARFAEAVGSLYHQPALWASVQSEAWRFLASEYSEEALRNALAQVLPLTLAR